MSAEKHRYRVEVYSGGRWVLLGFVTRSGPLLPAWKGAHLGSWGGFVKRVPSPGVQKKP